MGYPYLSHTYPDIHRADDLARMLLDHDRFVEGEEIEPKEEEVMGRQEPMSAEKAYGVDCGDGTVIYDHVVFTKAERITIGDHCRIDDFVKVEGGKSLMVGSYVHIASFVHLNIGGGELMIGDHAAFASGCKVITGGNRPDGESMSAASPLDMQVLVGRETSIGAYACLATNSIVLPGVNVGEGAVLGAGAVATKDLKPWTIYVAGVTPNGRVTAVELGPRPKPWEAK